jgi:surface protein
MWVVSNLYEELKEQDEYADIRECFNGHPLEEYLDDLIELTITAINYLKLIELCDYLMVTNADVLIDEIVKKFGIPVIHEFGEFYRYNSKRLQVHDRESLLKAIKWYCINPKKCYELYGFSAYWNVSEITNMSCLFERSTTGKLSERSKFNGDISGWDVSNVTTMFSMFHNSVFNGDISKWNVANVEDMGWMFRGSEFNGDVSKWDVSKVKTMECMFAGSKFNGDVSKWKVGNVINMHAMFSGTPFDGDVSEWDVSSVTSMFSMFGSSKFNGNVSKWKTNNVENMRYMFENTPFDGDVSEWNVEKVNDMSYMFRDTPFDGDVSKWNVSNVKYMSSMFRGTPNSTYKINTLHRAQLRGNLVSRLVC